MKKVLIMVLAMAVTSVPVPAKACWFTDLLTSAQVEYICSGTEGKLTAADMLTALETGKAIYAEGITAIDVSSAISILTVLRNTGCFVKDQLKLALKVVDAANAAKVQAKGPMFAASAKLPEYPALRKLVK